MSSHNWTKDNCCTECHKNVVAFNNICTDCAFKEKFKEKEEFYEITITESEVSITLRKPEEEKNQDFNEEDKEDEEDEDIDDKYEEYSLSDRLNNYDDDLDEYCIECRKNVAVFDNMCVECVYIFSSPA